MLKDIEAITRAKEANRKDREWFNHLSTIAEGAGCVGWVTIVSLSLVSGDGCWTISPVIAVAKARSVCQRNQGLDTILWESSNQRVQGEVSVSTLRLLSTSLIAITRDAKHAEWVKGYLSLLEELRKYIMEHHTTGLVWNPNVRQDLIIVLSNPV